MAFLPDGWVDVPGCFTGPQELYAPYLAQACASGYSTCPCPAGSAPTGGNFLTTAEYVDQFLPGLEGEFKLTPAKKGCCCGAGASPGTGAGTAARTATAASAASGSLAIARRRADRFNCWWFILIAAVLILVASDRKRS